jgi:hypothetical protein
MNNLKFLMGQQVTLTASGETGQIIGRAEYATSEPSYFLRYQASDGRAVEGWWSESALAAYSPELTA